MCSLFVVAHASETVLPLAPDQGQTRAAYRAAFRHIGSGGRLHWAQETVRAEGTRYAPGTLVAPDGIAGLAAHGADALLVRGAVERRPALALSASTTRVAVFRSTVTDPAYGNAGWELADVRETLDGYLWGTLSYTLLDEAALATADLSDYAILVIPSVQQGSEAEVVAALDAAALANIQRFVQGGGFLYAQSNGATIAEAAGLIPAGTVDLESTPTLAPGEPLNTGTLAIRESSSPLTFSWNEAELYLLNNPVYRAGNPLTTVAAFTNLEGASQPAILSGRVGEGQVILVNGHPTAPSHRSQVPIFLNALLWALGEPGELYGSAAQRFAPALPPDVLPAYETGVPVGVSLTFGNVWDAPLNHVTISTHVVPGFTVVPDTLAPTAQMTTTTAGTTILWDVGEVSPGEVQFDFTVETNDETMHGEHITVATSSATFEHHNRSVTIAAQPFTLTTRLAARLQANRDIAPARHPMLPREGLFLDVEVPIENKAESLASQVVITDVVVCLAPVLALENQETMLDLSGAAPLQNPLAAEAVWVRNEPFFYDERAADGTAARPYLPPDGYTPGDSITLEECDSRAVFAVPDIYGSGMRSSRTTSTETLSDTLPINASDYISTTDDGMLLLPTKVLTWTLDDWPGYHYEAPAIRYGIHSHEFANRAIIFKSDTTDVTRLVKRTTPTTDALVIEGSGGSIYTHLGSTPPSYREHLTGGNVAVPASPVPPMISFQDIWSRTHTIELPAAFYDIFTCNGCTPDGPPPVDDHAALNVTFELRADTDQDGVRDEPVLTLPTSLEGADLDILIKSTGHDTTIPNNQMVIDMSMFKGLGIAIAPRSGTWQTSWQSSDPATRLLAVERVGGSEHLSFQHGIASGGSVAVRLQATITSSFGAEGMFKLHDGARLTYRQQASGVSRYDASDTHGQGIIGEAPNLQVHKQVTPIEVSTYGDMLYYTFEIDDRSDPRRLERNGPADPFLQSYGFSDTAATTFVGGKEGRAVLHSIVQPGEQTRLRVEVNNNSGQAWRNLSIVPQPPAGITIVPRSTDDAPIPAPIFSDLPFLHAKTIADGGRGVYSFDVTVEPTYNGPRGRLVEIPIAFDGDHVPATFQVPAAQLGIQDETGSVYHTYGMAEALTLYDTIPAWAHLQQAALVSADDLTRLTDVTGAAEQANIFATFQKTLPFTREQDGRVQFALPPDALQRIYDPDSANEMIVVAQAVISPTRVGPNIANEGARIGYRDHYGMAREVRSDPVTVEAHGARVEVDYACTEVMTTPLQESETVCTPWSSVPAEAPAAIPADESSYAIAFNGATSHGDGTSTWSYTVTEVQGQDLSHWTLALPACAVVDKDSLVPPPGEAFKVEMGQDPTSGLDGITWDVADRFTTGVFTFTLDASACPGGDIQVGSSEVAVKSSGIGVSIITGPGICEGNPAVDDEHEQPEPDDEQEHDSESIDESDTPSDTGTPDDSFFAQMLPIPPQPMDAHDDHDDRESSTPLSDTGAAPAPEYIPGTCVLESASENEVVFDVIIYNAGDYPAQETEASLTLPRGISIQESTPAAQQDEQTLTWNLGDLAPGGRVVAQVRAVVTLDQDGEIVTTSRRSMRRMSRSDEHVAPANISERVSVVKATEGRFFEPYASQWVETPLTGAFHLPIRSGAATTALDSRGTIYLPFIPGPPAASETTDEPLPDLVVTDFSITPASPVAGEPAQVTVMVENQGDGAARPFWVDFYISPQPVPTSAGQRWDTLCGVSPCDGIAWSLNGLESGERAILTSEFYASEQSIWAGGFRVAGTHDLYVFVDSWNQRGQAGAITESDEGNNRAEIIGLEIGAGATPTDTDEKIVQAAR